MPAHWSDAGHSVFLTLGNLPNQVRNLPEAKVLLGFLPKDM